MECRYCFEGGDLIFPCKCTTGIHQKCLSDWLSLPPKKLHCEICLQEWDVQQLTVKDRCGPYYAFFNWTILCISLYLCLMGSFIVCNISMDTNVLQKYAILELIFHALVIITCSVFAKHAWFRIWAILRIGFAMWPIIYLTKRWLHLMSFESSSLLFLSLFKQWEIMAAIQCVYLIIVPVVFLRIRERPREDWAPMPIEVM